MGHYSTHEPRSQQEFEAKYLTVTKQGDKITDVVRMNFLPACHIRKIGKDKYMKGKYVNPINANRIEEQGKRKRHTITYWQNGEKKLEAFWEMLRYNFYGRYQRESKENRRKAIYHAKCVFFPTDMTIHTIATKEEPMRNRRSLKKIFKDLRQLIAANFEGGKRELFVTLTYTGAEQNNDPKKVHNDFRDFWKRLKRAYSDSGLGYVAVVEPHASGMFHIHALIRAKTAEYLYIPNQTMEAIWGHGSTETERLEDVDHMGAYVIAYMSNAELDPETAEKYAAEGDIVEKDGKKYIKGARLDYYPDGMQIHRHSRDIVKPNKLTGSEAMGELARLRALDAKAKYSNVKKIEHTDEAGNTRTAYVQTEQYKADLPWS